MKRYQTLSRLFAALILRLSHVMCAAVAYDYCSLQWGGQYACYSAPPDVAFLLCIPFGAGILICALLAVFFHKKHQKASQ